MKRTNEPAPASQRCQQTENMFIYLFYCSTSDLNMFETFPMSSLACIDYCELPVDLTPKKHHPSPYRMNYTDWIIHS